MLNSFLTKGPELGPGHPGLIARDDWTLTEDVCHQDIFLSVRAGRKASVLRTDGVAELRPTGFFALATVPGSAELLSVQISVLS